VTVSASASDNVGVAGVQFKLDGSNLGNEDTSAPYTISWDTTGLSGSHTLTAVARDAAGNPGTSAPVTVNVDNSAPPPPSGLVAAYSFENGSGTSLTDVTGKGHTGTIREAVWTTTGKNGKALKFDGVNDWVTINDAADLRLTTGMTLEAWVNPTSTSGWRTVLMKEKSAGLVYGLYTNSDTNRPSVHVFTSGETDTRGTAQVATNAWTHLASTFDGATLRLYVNGTLVSSKAVSGSMTSSTSALHIGGNAIWGEWFAGQIDDVRIYNAPLSAVQITADMNTPVTG
jgi:hypothetical protein